MRRHRGTLTILALLTLGIASAAVAVTLYLGRLPEPRYADEEQLLYWLVTRSIEDESADIQQQLVRRVERYLEENAGDLETDEITEQLDEQQAEQLAANGQFILGLWLRDRVDAYFELPKPQRARYIEQQMSKVTQWGALSWLTPDGQDDASGGILGQLGPWIEKQEPQQQARSREFLSAVAWQWMMGAAQKPSPIEPQ